MNLSLQQERNITTVSQLLTQILDLQNKGNSLSDAIEISTILILCAALERCESRNNHRYAIVVQDLATQRIQSYPCKTKT